MSEEPEFEPVADYLESCLSIYERDHEEFYTRAEESEEQHLESVLEAFAGHALETVLGGELSNALETALADHEPWEPLPARVAGLLNYRYVHKRIALDAAYEAVHRLHDVETRIRVSILAFLLSQRARPSETATKYLRQAVRLYIGGFRAEVFLMCGALLEAAMAHRITDAALRATNMKPKFGGESTFTVGQRMKGGGAALFTDRQRKEFWELVGWRNDVAHVQLDLVPDPGVAVLGVANLLPLILPADGLT